MMVQKRTLYTWMGLSFISLIMVLYLWKEVGHLSARTEILRQQLIVAIENSEKLQMKEDVELLKLDGAIMKEDEVVEAVHPQERSSVGETPPKVSHLPTFPTEPQEEEEELIVADEAWMAKRKELLAGGNPRKVVLFGYMRGGTSLLLEAFNQDSNAHAWYEPLGPLYGHLYGLPQFRSYTKIVFSDKKNNVFRDLPEYEIESLKTLLRSIFECDMKSMPQTVLANTFLARSRLADDYVQCITHIGDASLRWEHQCLERDCLSKYCGSPAHQITVSEAIQNECYEYLSLARGDNTVEQLKKYNPAFKLDADKAKCFSGYGECMQEIQTHIDDCLARTQLQQYCQDKNIRMAKILRLKLKAVRPLIKEFPDMAVIYYVRDPRAIASSRQFDNINPSLWATETKNLCKEMLQGYAEIEALRQRYPGAILFLKYEDLIESPIEKLRKLYSHFNETPNEAVKKWLVYTMYAGQDDHAFGVERKDAKETRDKWRTKYEPGLVEKVSKDPACEQLLNVLGYE